MPLDYYTPEQVGRTRSFTPEGFLVCRDVPISRIGTLLYGEHELQGLEGQAGVIHVERLAEDVFADHSIASYTGKPVIVTHSGGVIAPENFRDHMVGTVMNPRRGTDDDSNVILADLMIYDADTIQDILDKVGYQVSAGYNAEYEQLAPGRARQYEIIGNHVALVSSGRCGPRCSIGDEAMAIPRRKMRTRLSLDTALSTKIRNAFRTRDEAALEDALNTAASDPIEEQPGEEMGTADTPQTHNITVNINGPAVSTPADTAAPAMGDNPNPQPPAVDPNMPPWAQQLMARLAALEAKSTTAPVAAAAPAAAQPAPDNADAEGQDDDGVDDDITKDDASEFPAEQVDPETGKPRVMSGELTKDSADTRALFQDTMARAELLAPGVKLLTMDGKMTVKQTRDSLCAFRRRVLSKATGDAVMSQKIAPLVEGKDFKTMTCDAVTNTFVAASQLVKALNSNTTLHGFMPRPRVTSSSNVMTPAEINKANRALYNVT
jgi:hypothetical protein